VTRKAVSNKREVIGESSQKISAQIDLGDRLLLPRDQGCSLVTCSLHEQTTRVALDRRQRGAQFVGHQSKKAIFELFSFLEGGHILLDHQQ
jgi:hypothetical protein